MKLTVVLSLSCLFATCAAFGSSDAIDTSAIDKSANPCEDFFQYACGRWVKKTDIPSDRPAWVRGIDEVTLRNEKLMKEILENYSKGKLEPNVPYAKQMGDLYGACMDEKSIEKNARAEFKELLAPVLQLDSKAKIAALVGDLHLKGVAAFFDFEASQDLKNSDLMIGDVDQGGMGLPTKDYYLKDTDDMKRMRKAYADLVTSALVISGWTKEEAAKKADAVLAFETRLAKASLAPADHRDPIKLFHRLERKGLMKAVPQFDWAAYLNGLGQRKLTKINVEVPEFFKALNKTLAETSLDDIKAYLAVRMFSRMAPTMDKESVNTRFRFEHAALGTKELPPRWKRCVKVTGELMGMALGHAFVEKTFGAEGKQITTGMMHEIEGSMREDLKGTTWMDAPTRKAAIAKLAAAKNSMGYPDKWRNYDALQIDRNSYIKSANNGHIFASQYEMNKIGKPVDRDEWEMPPYLVNAENLPQFNQMRFPAGILQPPNFDAHRIPAANFGAIGSIMGHELTHSYDDEGRKFDKKGDMKEWWTKKTAAEFERRATCLANQYDQYVTEGDLHINGKLTLGENIADQGGVKISYNGWKASQPVAASEKEKGKFTDDQTFFIAFAQVWCSKETPEFRKYLTNSNPHSLPKYRVIGTLSNIPQFASAFNCKPGDKMVPKNQCAVW